MLEPDDLRLRDGAREVGFELEDLAGAGANGVVYRARTVESGQLVALKVFGSIVDPARFEREVDTISALDIPGVPAFRGVGSIQERRFVATEWVSGRSLAELLVSGPLAPERALDLFVKLASILDSVHQAGVVHRDLSPANIMVDADDSVHLIDFGLSQQNDAVTLTAEGIAPGTPRYLAPEVLEGAAATPASDQYGAAIVLYEMLTGRFAYRPTTDTLATTLHDHIHGTVIPPSEANPWLPASFDEPIERSLSREPSQRFASMSAFVAQLQRVESTPSPSFSRAPVLAGVAAALLLGGLVGWFVGNRSGDDSLTPPYLATVPDWRPGTAEMLDCNLLAEPGFDRGVMPVSFYDVDAERNELVDGIGNGRTAALIVGRTDEYGLFGQLVNVEPDTPYLFSVRFDATGTFDDASLRITWLDEEFEPIGDDVEFPLDVSSPGRVVLKTTPSPADAVQAVPTIEKGAGVGSLVIDEVVFASAIDECASEVIGE